MTQQQIAIIFGLMPVLLAAQDRTQLSTAAKNLVDKHRVGIAEVTLLDGTHAQMNIMRVTDRFIGVEQGGTCKNVELSQVVKIRWPKQIFDGEDLAYLIYAPVIPYWLIKSAIASRDPKLGSWQSIQALPNQIVEQVRFVSNDDPGKGSVNSTDVLVQTGHYRFEDGKLYTRDDDSSQEIAAEVRFECNRIIIDNGPQGIPVTAQPWPGRAQAPIVGRWVVSWGYAGPDYRGPTAWEFRPDGTFQIERVEKARAGSYEKAEGGITVSLNDPNPRKENWQIQTTKDSLSITRDGKTTEFKRRAQIY